jgi:hypothetical protein
MPMTLRSSSSGQPGIVCALGNRLVAGSPQKLHSGRLHQANEHPRTVGSDDQLYDESLGSLIERGLLTKEETDRKIAFSRILRHAPVALFGREKWLEALDAAWAMQHLKV